jgi:hypothetical protein
VGQQPAGDGRRQRRLAQHDLAQLVHQDLEAVFLEQIAVGTALQGREQVLVVRVERGHHLGGRVLAQFVEQFQPVAVRQFQVQQHQLERIGAVQAAGAGQGDLRTRGFQVTGLGDGDGVAEALFEHAGQEFPCDRVVFEDQHLH